MLNTSFWRVSVKYLIFSHLQVICYVLLFCLGLNPLFNNAEARLLPLNLDAPDTPEKTYDKVFEEEEEWPDEVKQKLLNDLCLLYTSPSPRD